jgi:O-succinylbenzoic acid--CoA ligase
VETSELKSGDFWCEDHQALTVLGNPRRDRNLQVVADAAKAFPEIEGNILVETSGSIGRPRFVCLSRKAMMVSARAVNEHLRVGSDDCWLCALPTFHVGGLSIYARGQAAAVDVVELERGWDPVAFCDAVDQSHATLTSLVPTQVIDLVDRKMHAPHSIRAVVVGGGHLLESIERRARELGWPLLRSYGMTEAASQIATQSIDEITVSSDEWLPILPHCQVRKSADDSLQICGQSLCDFYLDGEIESGFEVVAARDADGWMTTNDRGEVRQGLLRFLGRDDRLVKILGELVDVDQVEKRFRDRLDSASPDTVFVEPFADQRRGARLVPIIVEGSMAAAEVGAAIDEHNRTALPFERLEAAMWASELPRSALGKIRRGELRRLARSR